MNLQIYPWQTAQWKQLIAAHNNRRMPHALLLTGPDGTGMPEFAQALSACLLCENMQQDLACGHCRACTLLISGNYPDLFFVEPEELGKQIKVDDIRSLIDFTQLSSQNARYKIAVIHPAEAMNRNAANALLKTLEEPTANVVLILVSARPSRLPVTIRSRCQRIQFPLVGRDSGIDWISKRVNMDNTEMNIIWDLAQGRPLYALELIETDQVEQHTQVLTDLKTLLERPVDFMQISQKWYGYGTTQVFRWLVNLMAVMTRMKLVGVSGKDHMENNRDLQLIVNQLNLTQLVGCFDRVLRHYHAASGVFNLNQPGLLEDFLIYWQDQSHKREDDR